MVYVADRDRHVVVVFDAAGRIVRELGRRDTPAEETPFNHPADVAVAPDGTVFVADGYGNSRVHAFSSDGKHLRSWGSHGLGAGEFRVPHGIAVDSAHRVFVTDRENDRVQIFDASGHVLGAWTGFRGPTDICIDAAGRFFVTDHVPTLTALDAEGRVLVRMRAYHDTHGVCCDRSGRIFVASTSGRAVVCYTPAVSSGS
jgi:peptidylglycine monooxygenase